MAAVRYYIFLIAGILTVLVTFLGFIGNSLSILVLSHHDLRTSMSCLLIGLGISDLIVLTGILIHFIVYVIYYSGQPVYEVYLTLITNKTSDYLYILRSFGTTASIYFTVAITIERFIAICKPFLARKICIWENAKLFGIIIYIFSFFIHIPKFGRQYFINNSTMKTNNNKINNNLNNFWKIEITEYYQMYESLTFIIFDFFIPLSLIIVLNIFICYSFNKSKEQRALLTRSQLAEVSITKMLFCIVIIFGICHVIPFLQSIMEFFVMSDTSWYSYQGVIEILVLGYLLIAINSSVNFIIYSMLGKKFREIVCKFYQRSLNILLRNDY